MSGECGCSANQNFNGSSLAYKRVLVAGIMGSLFIHTATRIVQQFWKELSEERQRQNTASDNCSESL